MTPTPSQDTRLHIGGRLVILVHGAHSQTINVCTEANTRGHYEKVFRLRGQPEIFADDLGHLADLPALEAFAKEQGATEEQVGTRGTRLAALVPSPLENDAWVIDARSAVEFAITALIEEFIEHPYLHRVEHSVHARLFQLLAQQDVLSRTAVMATGHTTQLIHKEWPEPYPRDNQGIPGTRGLFDLAILAPQQVEAATLPQFRDGRIQPPLVIEVGLDYGLSHLQKDERTLLASGVVAPYLLHLNRLPVTDRGDVETLLDAAREPLRTAYAHVDVQDSFVKLPGDPAVRRFDA